MSHFLSQYDHDLADKIHIPNFYYEGLELQKDVNPAYFLNISFWDEEATSGDTRSNGPGSSFDDDVRLFLSHIQGPEDLDSILVHASATSYVANKLWEKRDEILVTYVQNGWTFTPEDLL